MVQRNQVPWINNQNIRYVGYTYSVLWSLKSVQIIALQHIPLSSWHHYDRGQGPHEKFLEEIYIADSDTS